MVSRVQGIWFLAWGTGSMVSKVRGTWFRAYGVHKFRGTLSFTTLQCTVRVDCWVRKCA